jgi:hypothetical protein
MYRRALWAAALGIAFAPVLAKADESIAGQWEADLGQGRLISMAILADGYWFSESVENGSKVGQMAGSYKQKKVNSTSGTLIFTPDACKPGSRCSQGRDRQVYPNAEWSGAATDTCVGKRDGIQ